jgi:hypothetical protein
MQNRKQESPTGKKVIKIKKMNIIGFSKKQRLNWLGHVERTAKDNIVQKINRWKPCPNDQSGCQKQAGNVTLGRHKEFECKQLENNFYRIQTDGRRYLSEPDPYTGCSASKEEEEYSWCKFRKHFKFRFCLRHRVVENTVT